MFQKTNETTLNFLEFNHLYSLRIYREPQLGDNFVCIFLKKNYNSNLRKFNFEFH